MSVLIVFQQYCQIQDDVDDVDTIFVAVQLRLLRLPGHVLVQTLCTLIFLNSTNISGHTPGLFFSIFFSKLSDEINSYCRTKFDRRDLNSMRFPGLLKLQPNRKVTLFSKLYEQLDISKLGWLGLMILLHIKIRCISYGIRISSSALLWSKLFISHSDTKIWTYAPSDKSCCFVGEARHIFCIMAMLENEIELIDIGTRRARRH